MAMARERAEAMIEFYRSMVVGTENRLADPAYARLMDEVYAREARGIPGVVPGVKITYREAYERQLANARDRLAYYQGLLL
jgi:hypothetical protein